MNTEDEAREKRCCGGAGCGAKKQKGAYNRAATTENWGGRQVERYCIASACMAWRTQNGISGYCGLAGK